MEEIYDQGRTRAIGVSNFDVDDLESLLGATDVVPHANQTRWFVGNLQAETTAYCKGHDILVEGYSPLATGELLDDAELARIARAARRPEGASGTEGWGQTHPFDPDAPFE